VLGYKARQYVQGECLLPSAVNEQGNIVVFSHFEVSAYVLRSRHISEALRMPGQVKK
jgi:hypothetical protein